MLDDMIGHEWAQDLLRRAAQRNRLGHAYLFIGPTSVGKTALAAFIAGLFVCTVEEPRPCGNCRACRNLARGAHPDIRFIERAQDRRDITIDQVRVLEEDIALAPYEGARKLFCISGAETLNAAAASALLKTLEEPPAHATLVLAATDPAALPSTIRSRCQQLTLQPVPGRVIAAGLMQEHAVDAERAQELAALARGRPGWAIGALSDAGLIQRERAARATIEDLSHGGPFSRLLAIEAWLGKGSFNESRERALNLLALLESYWRDALLLAAHGDPDSPLRAHLVGTAQHDTRTVAEVVAFLTRIQETAARVEANVQPRLALEHLLSSMPSAGRTANAQRG